MYTKRTRKGKFFKVETDPKRFLMKLKPNRTTFIITKETITKTIVFFNFVF